MTYQPKGSMCANCAKKKDDCSKFPFDKMRKFAQDGDVAIVICTEFIKCKK